MTAWQSELYGAAVQNKICLQVCFFKSFHNEGRIAKGRICSHGDTNSVIT